MLDVVSSMAGRYLEGGGGEVATWPQLNQREGGEKAPLLVSTTLARRARVEMFATFFTVLGKSVFRINPTVFMKIPASCHLTLVCEC